MEFRCPLGGVALVNCLGHRNTLFCEQRFGVHLQVVILPEAEGRLGVHVSLCPCVSP